MPATISNGTCTLDTTDWFQPQVGVAGARPAGQIVQFAGG